MTEAEWLAAKDPIRMMPLVERRTSDRKRRLFACACCRMAWDDFEEDRIKALVTTSELFADGAASLDQLNSAQTDAQRAYADNQGMAGNQDVEEAALGCGVELNLSEVMRWASLSVAFVDSADRLKWWSGLDAEQEERNRAFGQSLDKGAQTARTEFAKLLRDIFANPFRPCVPEPAWFTSTVIAIAHGIYADRAFDRLPILADALQDAGCEDADILAHCRGDGPHVRGCWVVDLVLGKS